MSYSSVFTVLGWALALFSAAMTLPGLTALAIAGEGVNAGAFLASALLTVFVGVALIMTCRDIRVEITRREGFLIVILCWTVLSLFGALPFYLGGVLDNVTDAYFEALSGLTTNGATVLDRLEEQPRSILLWRAMLQWFGGLGTVVFTVALSSAFSLGGQLPYRSAMPRGSQSDPLLAMRASLRTLGGVYVLLTLVCVILLWFAGMPAFDALCHAMSALSTGGFSTRDASVAAFDNGLVEGVLMIFMLAGAVNFTLHWALFKGKPKAYLGDPEVAYLLFAVLICALIAVAALAASHVYGVGEGLRQGLFAVLSVVTTTGFMAERGSVIAQSWPAMLSLLLLLLVIVGGSVGSMAGGVKLMRLSLLLKQASSELSRLSFPHGVVRIRYGGEVIAEEAVSAAWSYFMIFALTLGGLAAALAATGLDFRLALSAAAVNLSGSGPALPMLAGEATQAFAGYGALADPAKWLLSLAMLLGRVEFFAILSLFNPAFWRR